MNIFFTTKLEYTQENKKKRGEKMKSSRYKNYYTGNNRNKRKLLKERSKKSTSNEQRKIELARKMSIKERYENLKRISTSFVEQLLDDEIPIMIDDIPTLIKLIEININHYHTGIQSRNPFRSL